MEKLTLPARITGFLKRLMEKRSLLTVLVEGHKQEFNSAIIDISIEDNSFSLDELMPEEGHKLLETVRKCHVKGAADGVNLSFDVEIDEVASTDGIPFYRARIPSVISYLQRRAAHRVTLSAANPIPVELRTKGGTLLIGSLNDISLGGLKVRFDDEISTQLALADLLDCSFAIDDNKINCEVILRFVRTEHEKFAPATLGCQFTNLIKPQERALQRMVMNLERAARQKG